MNKIFLLGARFKSYNYLYLGKHQRRCLWYQRKIRPNFYPSMGTNQNVISSWIFNYKVPLVGMHGETLYDRVPASAPCPQETVPRNRFAHHFHIFSGQHRVSVHANFSFAALEMWVDFITRHACIFGAQLPKYPRSSAAQAFSKYRNRNHSDFIGWLERLYAAYIRVTAIDLDSSLFCIVSPDYKNASLYTGSSDGRLWRE